MKKTKDAGAKLRSLGKRPRKSSLGSSDATFLKVCMKVPGAFWPRLVLDVWTRVLTWATVGRLPRACRSGDHTGVSTKSGHSEAVSGTSWLRLGLVSVG